MANVANALSLLGCGHPWVSQKVISVFSNIINYKHRQFFAGPDRVEDKGKQGRRAPILRLQEVVHPATRCPTFVQLQNEKFDRRTLFGCHDRRRASGEAEDSPLSAGLHGGREMDCEERLETSYGR
uniref:(northern house mosquito) hypothetical protein n=1 Tax=Culex pipiens TaxID=7175 RepID=A0A8D8KAK0_CULPI